MYEEKEILLKETKQKLIREIAGSATGQSLREELVDIMSEVIRCKKYSRRGCKRENKAD